MDKKYFTQTSYIDNANEVASWLAEHASEYFDAVTADTETAPDNPVIICSIGETEVLKFATNHHGASNTLIINTQAGATVSYNGGGTTVSSYTFIDYAIKTDYGIWLVSNQVFRLTLAITKTNENTTALYAYVTTYKSGSNVYGVAADLVRGTAIDTGLLGRVTESTMTALVPICVTPGAYTPNLFLTPYTQHKGVVGRINMAGTGYLYDGYVALKC